MADNKDDDDSGEHTQFTPLRPPTLGQPPKKEEPKPAGEDRTMSGAAPPPPLKPATPPPAAPPPPSRVEEATDHTIADMAPPKQAPPPSGGFEDEGATVVLGPSQRATCSLQRIEPPGHGDVITLSRSDYLLGRSRTCDIPLYSTTASREHARLSKRGDSWYLTPEEGKTVIAAGSTLSGEVKLVHKMRLQFGGDELLFFDERAATAPAATRAATAVAGVEEKKGSRTGLVVAVVAILIAVAAVAAYVLLFKP
jgi:hypothetical protein